MSSGERDRCSAEVARPIRIGGEKRWIAGIDAALAEVRVLGLTDEAQIGEEIYRRLRGKNPIPEDEVERYRIAFQREYRARTPCC